MGNLVLPSCQGVMRKAEHVSINSEAVDQVALRFAAEQMKIPSWDLPVFPSSPSPETIDFFILGNSINFAFRNFSTKKDFTTEYAGQEWRGAMAMWASLKRALDLGKPITFGPYLENISDEDVKEIFSGSNPIPLVDERAKIFREVGHVLRMKYGNYFSNLVERSGNRLFNNGDGLVDRLITDFPSFDDFAVYKRGLVDRKSVV